MVQKIGEQYSNHFRGEKPNVKIEMNLIDSTNRSSAVWKVNEHERVVVDSHYKSRWRVRIIEDNLSRESIFCDETLEIQDAVEQAYAFAEVVWVDKSNPQYILSS